MRGKQIVFTEPNRVELQDFEFDAANLAPDEIAIETHYSLISAGTELACLRGKESWAKLPFTPGYAACGEVIATGNGVQTVSRGDFVFAYTKHASHAKTNRLYARVPEGLDGKLAVFARMAAVSITALRVSDAELGDYVAVLGLGLVGNLAAQLFTLSGCEVIGIDLSPKRVELARRCGVKYAVNASAEDVAAAVERITEGRMCEVVVEASGNPAAAETAASLAGKLGEVVLVGSPRDALVRDITPLLQMIHLWKHGCVTFKGAHEWRYPVKPDAGGHAKHSIQRNIEILLRLIAERRLRVEELLTHVLSPEECVAAYEGLDRKRDEYIGVVFDWGKVKESR